MKKIISVILCFCLILSVSINAFAVDENELVLNETQTITLSADEELVFTFNPKITGKYKITVKGETKAFTEVTISSKSGYLVSNTVITTDVKRFNGHNLQEILAAIPDQLCAHMFAETDDLISIKISDKTTMSDEAFEEYGLKGIMECFAPSTVSITVEPADLVEINTDSKSTVDDEALFEFIPEKTGEYGFFCNTTNGAVNGITIWDSEGILSFGYGKSEYTVFLKAGENYIIKCCNTKKDYSGNVTGSYTFEIKYVHDHSFGEWVYNEDATFFKDGTKTHGCICGEQETEINEGTSTIAVIFNRFYEALLWLVNLFVK